MNQAYIPGPIDAVLAMEGTGVTRTADYVGASLDMGIGFAPGGIGQPVAAVIEIAALDFTTTDETYKFVLEESSDNSSFTACGPIITVGAAGALTFASIPGFLSKRYVRANLDVGGTTPSISYKATLVPLGPLA